MSKKNLKDNYLKLSQRRIKRLIWLHKIVDEINRIAYSSNWRDGVYLVDVGNGIAGGSPSNPVAFGNYTYDSGANHAAFPFKPTHIQQVYWQSSHDV